MKYAYTRREKFGMFLCKLGIHNWSNGHYQYCNRLGCFAVRLIK